MFKSIDTKLINLTLWLNKKLFFKKKHPFNEYQNGALDINYTDFEYSHAEEFLAMYKDFIDLWELKNKKTLEVGCGWAWKSLYIAETYGTTWVWIDLNDTFLRQASQKAKQLKLDDKLIFTKENALDMSFKDEEFDFIILSDVLEHIPNTKKLLEECYRVLKKWGYILFDFAPYYHYFWHHLWDTIQIPWLHVFTSEAFRIRLYKESLVWFSDKEKRLDLRIGKDKQGNESFTYLNKITRADFEEIIEGVKRQKSNVKIEIKYFILKDLDIFWKIPLLRELFIRHIVGVIKKI